MATDFRAIGDGRRSWHRQHRHPDHSRRRQYWWGAIGARGEVILAGRAVLFMSVLAFIVAACLTAKADEARVGGLGIANTGKMTVGGNVTIGIPAEELKELTKPLQDL